MPPAIDVRHLDKVYDSGFRALNDINLRIETGELFALLGPNGAGKTTLISIICGLVTPSGGQVTVGGHDVIADYRAARSRIGLVPQELSTDAFERVWNTVRFSRGLFGKPPNARYLEALLRDLSLWDKRNDRVMALSGGMKRRLLIAKALAHEPDILFLDEPTAGVDVELRQDMWQMIRRLQNTGVTVVLTTHYIEEAEHMADRIGVINRGEIVLVEQTTALMRQLGKKQLALHLQKPLDALPADLQDPALELTEGGATLIYTFDIQARQTGIAGLMRKLNAHGIDFKDLQSRESSLEEIFVNLIRDQARSDASEPA